MPTYSCYFGGVKKTKKLKHPTLLLFGLIGITLITGLSQKAPVKLQTFCEKQANTYTVNFNLPSKDIGYLDRYELHSEKATAFLKSKTTQSNAYSYQIEVYPRIRLAEYKFSSQQKAGAALDSLLTCFPNDCHRLEKGKKASVKFVTSIMIFNERAIYMAVTNCEYMGDQWDGFKDAFLKAYVKPESTIILTSCGRVTWTTGTEMLEKDQ